MYKQDLASEVDIPLNQITLPNTGVSRFSMIKYSKGTGNWLLTELARINTKPKGCVQANLHSTERRTTTTTMTILGKVDSPSLFKKTKPTRKLKKRFIETTIKMSKMNFFYLVVMFVFFCFFCFLFLFNIIFQIIPLSSCFVLIFLFTKPWPDSFVNKIIRQAQTRKLNQDKKKS